MNTFLAWLLITGLYLNIFVVVGFISYNGMGFILEKWDTKAKQRTLTQALVREVENNHGKEATIVIITKTHEILVAPKSNKESQND